VGASYNQEDYIKSYLSLREVIASLEQQRINAAKYDTPCESIDRDIELALFLKWCFENFGCYTLEEKYKVISKANRVAKNCQSCPGVTQAQIDAFILTDEGRALLWQADMPEGLILFDKLTFLVYYENGLPILLEI